MPFSRDFNHDPLGGDIKDRLGNPPSNNVCKSSFLAWKAQNLLTNNPTTVYIKIGETIHSSGRRVFSMTVCNVNHQQLETLVADLPCPNQCVPPEQMIPSDNTFSRDHLSMALSFPEITYINVHAGIRRDGASPIDTHMLYAVTGEGQTAVAQDDPGDPIYTSIEYLI